MSVSPKGWAGFLRMMEPIYASMPGGKEMHAQLVKTMDVLTKHVKGGMVATIDIKPGAFGGYGLCESDDPAAYIEAMKPFAQTTDMKSLGITMGPMNYVPPAEGPAAMPAEQRKVVESLFGKDGLSFALVPLDKVLLFAMGRSDDDLAAAIAAAREGKSGASGLAAAIDASGKDAAMVMKMDLRAVMALAALSPEFPVKQIPSGAPVDLLLSLTAKERMLRGRMSLDYQALASLVKSMMK
jgi:hypothetical protein